MAFFLIKKARPFCSENANLPNRTCFTRFRGGGGFLFPRIFSSETATAFLSFSDQRLRPDVVIPGLEPRARALAAQALKLFGLYLESCQRVLRQQASYKPQDPRKQKTKARNWSKIGFLDIRKEVGQK